MFPFKKEIRAPNKEYPRPETTHMAVAQKTGIPKWVALLSGNMGTKTSGLPPDRLVLSHTHLFQPINYTLPKTTKKHGAPKKKHTWGAKNPRGACLARRTPCSPASWPEPWGFARVGQEGDGFADSSPWNLLTSWVWTILVVNNGE